MYRVIISILDQMMKCGEIEISVIMYPVAIGYNVGIEWRVVTWHSSELGVIVSL